MRSSRAARALAAGRRWHLSKGRGEEGIGGLGGGPWLDGRVRALVAAISYSARAIDDGVERYANVARIALDAITTFAEEVRAGRQILGAALSKT
jgi:hypothetical protein